MPTLELKPTHKLVQAYYAALAQFDQHRVTRETAVRQPFLDLLRAAASPRGLTVEAEFPMSGTRGHRIIVDAALRDAFWRPHGYWEAKAAGDFRTKRFARLAGQWGSRVSSRRRT